MAIINSRFIVRCLGLILCSLEVVQSVISVVPRNQAVYAGPGSTVELECAMSETKPVVWARCDNTCIQMTFDGDIMPPPGDDDSLYDRHSLVDKSETGTKQYNLRIRDVQMGDAGRYRCSDFSNGVRGFSELIVLETPPVCSWNLTDGQVEVDDKVTISCELKYSGRWGPKMRILDIDGSVIPATIDESVGQNAKYIIEHVVGRAHHGQRLSVQVYFEPPVGAGENEATNTPEAMEVIQILQPLAVFHPPGNVNVASGPLEGVNGYAVECIAEGNPAPTYMWTEVNGTSFPIEGSIMNITRDMRFEPQLFECEACNTYFGRYQCDSINYRPNKADYDYVVAPGNAAQLTARIWILLSMLLLASTVLS